MAKPRKQSKAEGKILKGLGAAARKLAVKLTDDDKWRAVEILREKQREQRKNK